MVGSAVVEHGKQVGHEIWLRLFLLTDSGTSPHSHGGQVTCTVGSVGSAVVGSAVVGSAVVEHGKHVGHEISLRLFLPTGAGASPHSHGGQVT